MTNSIIQINPLMSLVVMSVGVVSEEEGIITSFLQEYLQILIDLRWMIILGAVLVISDFWFGISESRVRKKKIRRSSACRRTINKSIDYFCYITLGSILGKVLQEYYGLDAIVISVSVMILCYAFEIDSIYGHICAIHGIKKHYSIWKLIKMLFTFKFNSFKQALDDMNNQSKENREKKLKKDSL